MNYETFIKDLPLSLNKQQEEAVKTVDGPVLLLAVPGSGKTTVLVTRLGYMIYCKNISPSNILTLTYTVAATNDMRARFSKFFGEELGSQLEFRTINSICAGIIKEYGRRIGKEPYELISDEKRLIAIISGLYQKYENAYPTESDLKGIKTWITYIKNMMLSDSEIKKLEKEAKCHLLDIYNGYCSELKSHNRMDYDDQMIYAYKLLKSSSNLLQYYQNLYPYICVDEAQDTSKIQHEIIALLAKRTENLFMVGDEDQSIYGFRAAYPEALLSFENNHKNAKVLLMEENYRSNANIVNAADMFIQKNTLRHEKHIKATRDSSSEINKIELNDKEEQYQYLLKVAKETTAQTAVLYRDNESAIPLVDIFERNSIPYRIRNAELSFFTHRIVIDIQNILLFSFNTKNTELFESIYYKISTYLNKKMALQACELSKTYNISVFSAILKHMDINSGMRKKIQSLEKYFNNMRNENPYKAIKHIVDYMGYGDYMDRSGMSDTKILILEALAKREYNITGFLNRLEKLKDIIQNKENDYECNFILSTIHGSKGLEYDNVYLIDLQDGLFPENIIYDIKSADKEELKLYEEERRLFYVGITRAKNNLFVLKTNEPSIFIKQLLRETTPNLRKNTKVKNFSYNERAPKKIYTKSEPLYKEPFDEAGYRSFIYNLSDGVLINHSKYGQGVVISSNDKLATILFKDETKSFDLKTLYIKNLIKIL